MAANSEHAGELKSFAERLTLRLGDRRNSTQALKLVQEHSADEQLALAFLLRLAEQSPENLNRALADLRLSRDLIFCLGASEFVAGGLCAMDSGWLEFFQGALGVSAHSLATELHLKPAAHLDRRDATAYLAKTRMRLFLKIAIGDLLGATSVAETMILLSHLAEECIRFALTVAKQDRSPTKDADIRFCVMALGKLGVRELNLSSDIDLVYLYDAPATPDAIEAATRVGEILT
jgi:glutamate-ammonia-ligase adenylyltransferase